VDQKWVSYGIGYGRPWGSCEPPPLLSLPLSLSLSLPLFLSFSISLSTTPPLYDRGGLGPLQPTVVNAEGFTTPFAVDVNRVDAEAPASTSSVCLSLSIRLCLSVCLSLSLSFSLSLSQSITLQGYLAYKKPPIPLGPT